MPRVDLVVPGFTIRSDQTRLGVSTVALVRGERTTVVDAAIYGRRTWIVERLRVLGMAPEQVDALVLTHLHWDHMQNFDLFPNATIYVHPAELEYARGRADWATMRYVAAALAERTVEPVEEGFAVEPGARILATPGHTGGSMSLVVDTPEGTVGIVGDALPNARTAIARKPYLIFYDERAAEASAAKILGQCQVLYCGHDRPFRLLPGGQQVEYLEPASITVQVGFGLDERDQAATFSSADAAVSVRDAPPAPLHVVQPDGTTRSAPWQEVGAPRPAAPAGAPAE
ncbi:MAG TPA: MBL fold metallo-hydrolase [Chloroflexota bacterium]|jgi:glyoxylase-like metal-dependent hydrolase (beta-lactamase superfamily II)